MRETINWKSVVVALLVALVGVLMILADIFWIKTKSYVWISIGCSLIASGMVILLSAILVDKIQVNQLESWGLERIYYTRSEQNTDTDPQLRKAKYKIDAVVFGLKSFRDKHGHLIEECLNRGVNIRILTMDPEGKFIAQREIEEKVGQGSIKQTIEQLVLWADSLNEHNRKGRILIKGYNCMTLDFYWRVDDTVCIGPYWYGTDSQQTITYKFKDDDKNGMGFKQYVEHFERLWNDADLSRELTKPVEQKSKRRNKTD